MFVHVATHMRANMHTCTRIRAHMHATHTYTRTQTFVGALQVLPEGGCESVRRGVGQVWGSLDAIEACPLDNKTAIFKRLTTVLAAMKDAAREAHVQIDKAAADSGQVHILAAVQASLSNPARVGKVFFVNARGGCGKAFVFKAILKMARGKGLVVLLAASSGIAGVLLEGGAIAHSRFKIPVDSLPVLPAGSNRAGTVAATLKSSDLWPIMKVFRLEQNMRVKYMATQDSARAATHQKWACDLLDIGKGVGHGAGGGAGGATMF
eukprot:330017-Chlamydomonas_euryale.AAC.1